MSPKLKAIRPRSHCARERSKSRIRWPRVCGSIFILVAIRCLKRGAGTPSRFTAPGPYVAGKTNLRVMARHYRPRPPRRAAFFAVFFTTFLAAFRRPCGPPPVTLPGILTVLSLRIPQYNHTPTSPRSARLDPVMRFKPFNGVHDFTYERSPGARPSILDRPYQLRHVKPKPSPLRLRKEREQLPAQNSRWRLPGHVVTRPTDTQPLFPPLSSGTLSARALRPCVARTRSHFRARLNRASWPPH